MGLTDELNGFGMGAGSDDPVGFDQLQHNEDVDPRPNILNCLLLQRAFHSHLHYSGSQRRCRGMTKLNGNAPKVALDKDMLAAYTLDEAMARSHAILDNELAKIADSGRTLKGVVALYSGGNDSTTLFHLMRNRVTHAAHANTTIGIEQTRQFVRDTCAAYGVPLIEKKPPDSYRDLVLGKAVARSGPNKGRVAWSGFPGPAGHRVMFTRLKERCLEAVRRDLIEKNRGHQQRVVFLAGMRLNESDRRWRNTNEVDYEGSTVWVSPIAHWTDEHMREYRRRYDVPRNEVSDLLHMSGECLCGAFAHPGELDEIALWFPEVAAEIRALEQEAEELGIAACKWGKRPPKGRGATAPPNAGRLCSTCTVRGETEDTKAGFTVEEWISDPGLSRRS